MPGRTGDTVHVNSAKSNSTGTVHSFSWHCSSEQYQVNCSLLLQNYTNARTGRNVWSERVYFHLARSSGEKQREREQEKKQVKQDRRENERTQRIWKGQEINRKRDKTSSGQIVTIVFVSSLQHQVSLSSPAHNLITLFTVQIAHAQMRQEGRSRWILLLANPRFER